MRVKSLAKDKRIFQYAIGETVRSDLGNKSNKFKV